MGVAGALLANLVIFGALGLFSWLNGFDSDLFYRSVQEDEWIEWGTFWAFLLAAGAFGWAAVRQRRVARVWPWFLAGVGLFCFAVAMEEISWGQRILGYRPPAYFLAHNYQQELNVHNVMDSDLRKLSVKVVILGYGAVLPLLGLVPGLAGALRRLAVVPPPVELVPGFLAAFWIYDAYPFKFSGEITELMMGFCFLFAGLAPWRELAPPAANTARRRLALPVAVATGLVVGLGAANAWSSRSRRSASPELLEAARAELWALTRDFHQRAREIGGLPSRCGVHKRLYTFRRQYGQRFLDTGQFAALGGQGLPAERAEFFLDPWNSPYWLRDKCSPDRRRRVVFVYSFGPNRRRDSSAWEVRGDDVGGLLLVHPRE